MKITQEQRDNLIFTKRAQIAKALKSGVAKNDERLVHLRKEIKEIQVNFAKELLNKS